MVVLREFPLTSLPSDCEVSKVSGSARMRPWMKSEENNSIGDKNAPPKPRYVPRLGKLTRMTGPLASDVLMLSVCRGNSYR